MDLLDAITARKSIRAFRPEPVPQSVLQALLQLAIRAPSSMNTQPWEFFVVSGEPLARLKTQSLARLAAGEAPRPEHSVTGWPRQSVFRERQVALARDDSIFELPPCKIRARETTKSALKWPGRAVSPFDAPTAIIVCTDGQLTPAGPLIDIGAVVQTLCLAALAFDLGTCIEDQGVAYPEIVRAAAGIPADKRIVTAVAVGYPDWEFPANRLASARDPVAAVTRWCGFDQD
ncbi:MAG: nitroreductase [Desulfobacterales bacterium]|nr:nitroreductase [Desulfobacterales bacterium]